MLLSTDEPERDTSPAMAPGWMITFADLLSLLLAFFVLMFATTSVDQKEWERAVQPISTYLTGRTIQAAEVTLAPVADKARLDLAYLATLIEGQAPALAGAKVERDEHAIIVSLRANAVWHGVEPAPLADLARLLSSIDNRIEVVAHVGADPSPNAVAAADWHRALDQAIAVAGELKRLGYAKPVGASGSVDLAGVPTDAQVDLRVYDMAAEAMPDAP
jgi:chemotaxis protein MotB